MSSAKELKAEGDEKVVVVAQQIVKSLATSKNAADDMISILSRFDHRLSSFSVLFPSSASSSAAVGDADDVKARLDAAERVILQWDATDESLYETSADDAALYITAVDDAIAIGGGRAELAVHLAMTRLEAEFLGLMRRNSIALDASGLCYSLSRLSLSVASDSTEDFDTCTEPDHQDSSLSSPAASAGGMGRGIIDEQLGLQVVCANAVQDLKGIAERMITAGYGNELARAYCAIRQDILQGNLLTLGINPVSIEDVQRLEWKVLDDKMHRWVQGIKIAVKGLLLGEHRLCSNIFQFSEELREECFVEATKGCILQFLNFGDAVTVCSRAPEKLVKTLDMYESLADVMPDLSGLFMAGPGKMIYEDAAGVLDRLGDTARAIFHDIGNCIQKETSQQPTPNGMIHPMLRYMMNYMKLIVDYADTLNALLDDGSERVGGCPETDNVNSEESAERISTFGRHFLALASYLESFLENKSKLYEDPALQSIFMMNNLHYMVQKAKESEVGSVLGTHWIRTRRGKIRQNSTTYLRTCWTKTLSYLTDDQCGTSSGSPRMQLKDKFRHFYASFEELHRIQTAWRVPEQQLREELRIAISEIVIPAYRSFTGRLGNHLDAGRPASRYMKYTEEELEAMISEFFEGSSRSSVHSRRSLIHI